MRYLKFCALLVAAVFLSADCGEKKVYRIGVSQCSSDDWRSKMNDEMAREIMLHDDAEIEIRSADDSNEKQIADIRYFADNGFDIIIAAPNEAAPLTPVIGDVYRRGIPVIIFDRDILGDTYTARIGADDYGIGEQAAKYGRNLVQGAVNIIEIQGRKGSTPSEHRHSGFGDAVAADPEMTILGTAHANWKMEDAVVKADSLLTLYPQANLIYAHNDRMAIGVSQVVRSRGRADIKIIGIDAAPEIGIRAVADGVIDATFLYPTEGNRVVRTALSILKGEPFEREVVLPLSSAVDMSNADILLLQNESLRDETEKMKTLKGQVDEYWKRHSAQTTLVYAAVVILVLLSGVIFLLLRAFWQRRRHQEVLEAKNLQLEEERDKQVMLNRQLNEATQSKLMFFTNVSHDLRTPLTLIAEPVEQLATASNLTPQQHSLMSIANRNVKILKRLINEILDFRKFENGKMELRLTEVDFGRLVKEWSESFLALARKRRIKFEIDVCGEGEAVLAVDVEKMERVFFNIMGNAFKYTPDNGTIRLTCGCNADRFEFSVSDTGKGILAEDVGRIFDRFFQVDKVYPQGSGIGLSLAKAFVELHEGEISVTSELGKGSKFVVSVPMRHVGIGAAYESVAGEPLPELNEMAEMPEPQVQLSDYGAAADKPVLLVIDDNADIRALLSSMMQDEYNVITAPDGARGVRMAAKYVPDLIICDVMMPGMDGMECCRRIKEETATSHIPVLMLTACSMDEQRVQGYDSGADGYLSKPFSREVLVARCRNLIESRKRIRDLRLCPGVKPEPSVKAPGDVESEFYARFMEVAQAELGNPDIGVDGLAAKMGLGRSQFYRKIKALTNFSPVELLRDMRLQRARSLLVSTENTISEIAYETGFSTPAYFTKCFRDAFGETPSDFRAKLVK